MHAIPDLLSDEVSTERPIRLVRRSDFSYDVNNVPALETWLRRQGYRSLTCRIIIEWARLVRGESLIVIYQSGTVVLQGRDIDGARALLAPLVVTGGRR